MYVFHLLVCETWDSLFQGGVFALEKLKEEKSSMSDVGWDWYGPLNQLLMYKILLRLEK